MEKGTGLSKPKEMNKYSPAPEGGRGAWELEFGMGNSRLKLNSFGHQRRFRRGCTSSTARTNALEERG